MLTKITVRNLKRLRQAEITLIGSVIFAGTNNCGKTTALQALSIWHFATRRWIEEREDTPSKAKERSGVAITRRDFSAIPVRRLDLLWTGRAVGRRKGEARPPLIEIIVEGHDGVTAWTWGMELQYQGAELLYCRASEAKPVPDSVRRLTVIHVPPLGGIQTDEERRETGIQDRLIGEGRPGDILRNLLLQIAEREPEAWRRLSGHFEEMSSPLSRSGPLVLC